MKGDLLQKLNLIFDQEFVKPVGGEVVLEEQAAKVRIKKRGQLLHFAVDKSQEQDSKDLFPYFSSTVKGLRKINDHILFYQVEDKLLVFIIELKSTATGGILSQVESGYVFAKFLVETFKRINKLWDLKVEFVGVLFSRKYQKPTSSSKIKYYIKPGSHLKYFTFYNQGMFYLDWVVNSLKES